MNQEFECLDGEVQTKLLRIYNSHFTGSCLWDFDTHCFQMLTNSWNVNLRTMYNLPIQTHNWIVERISGDKHAKQLIFKRYIKFIESLEKNKRPSLQFLLKLVQRDQRCTTGSNLRHIYDETEIFIVPGKTIPALLDTYQVYKTPVDEDWKIPLIISLMSIRDSEWVLNFDENDPQPILQNDIERTLERLCSN